MADNKTPERTPPSPPTPRTEPTIPTLDPIQHPLEQGDQSLYNDGRERGSVPVSDTLPPPPSPKPEGQNDKS